MANLDEFGNDANALRMVECSICVEIPLKAMETTCCSQIICEDCVRRMHGDQQPTIDCPLCRKEALNTAPVKGVLKRIIESITVPCPNKCNQRVTIGNLGDHEKVCEKRGFLCRFCATRCPPLTFFDHLEKSHYESVLSFCSSKEPEAEEGIRVLGHKTNSRGKVARLGDTGKFYCGDKLDFKCPCCNGNCGPDNGCNCTACQHLDIQMRNLKPGFYVNSSGAMSYFNRDKDSFHCMRRVTVFSARRTALVCDADVGPCINCKGLNAARSKEAFRALNP